MKVLTRASLFLFIVTNSFGGNDGNSTNLLIDFSELKNQFFGKTYATGEFLFYSGYENGKLWDGNDIGVFKDDQFEGIFSLDGAQRFIVKTVDGSNFNLKSFRIADPFTISSQIFIEGYRNGELIIKTEVMIGSNEMTEVELGDSFLAVDEIRIGSANGAGIWNYFNDFNIQKSYQTLSSR